MFPVRQVRGRLALLVLLFLVPALPACMDLRTSKAEAMYHQGRTAEALTLCNEVIEDDAFMRWQAHLIRGRIRLRAGLPEQALADFDASLEHCFPAWQNCFGDLYYERSKCHEALGHREPAAADRKLVLRLLASLRGPDRWMVEVAAKHQRELIDEFGEDYWLWCRENRIVGPSDR